MKPLELPSTPEQPSAGDLLLEAIADAIANRLEHRHGASKRLLTLDQSAEYMGCSEDLIERFVSEGKLVPVRFDRRLRFDIRELDKLIEESKRRR